MMVCTLTPTIQSRDLRSILAFRHAQRTISRRSVAPENTIRQQGVNQATIQSLSKPSVQMRTVLVSSTYCRPSLSGKRTDISPAAFDDQTSTFIIPSGAGFEVVFCPGARSTNILATESEKMRQLSQTGRVSKDSQKTMSKRKRVDASRGNGATRNIRLDGTVLMVTFLTTAYLVAYASIL